MINPLLKPNFNFLSVRDDKWWATCWLYRSVLDFKLLPVRSIFRVRVQPFYSLEFRLVTPWLAFGFATEYGTPEEFQR